MVQNGPETPNLEALPWTSRERSKLEIYIPYLWLLAARELGKERNLIQSRLCTSYIQDESCSHFVKYLTLK